MSACTLNFVSGIATPPVNLLLRAVAMRPDVRLSLWYAEEADASLYSWKTNPTHEFQRAEIYGKRLPSASLLHLALGARDQCFMIVGWANPTTRLLIPILAAQRRRFAYFTDRPSDRPRSIATSTMRHVYLGFLRRHSTVFGVGRTAVEYFAARGISSDRLCNLPLPAELPESIRSGIPSRDSVRNRFNLPSDGFFVVTGSRLVASKGFDLLVAALTRLTGQERARIRVLIVGSGPEKENLETEIHKHGLDGIIRLEPWMEFVDFCGCIGAADVVIHPARFDAYGGISLTAVGLGVPIIGTRQSGSAVELVVDGRTGFLYDATDVAMLASHLQRLMGDRVLCESMHTAALNAAANWTAERLAGTLVTRLFQDGILQK